MGYIVISDDSLPTLLERVNEKIKTGWRPFGSVVISNGWYYQLMFFE